MDTEGEAQKPATPFNRRSEDAWRHSIDEKIKVLAASHSELRAGLSSLLDLVEHNTKLTKDIADIVETATAFFNFLGKCGRAVAWCGRMLAVIAKPVGIIAAAASSVYLLIYQLFHNGNLPK